MQTNTKYDFLDFIWLVYIAVMFTFNCAFDNVQMLSTIILTMIMLFRELYMGKGKIVLKKMFCGTFLWYFFFFAFASIARFWSSSEGIAYLNVFTTLIQILCYFLCLELYVVSSDRLKKLINSFCFATFFFAAVVLLTSPPSTYNSLEFGSFTGMQRNTTGYVLMFGTFFNVYVASKNKNRLYYVMAAVCAIGALCTGSRKVIIGCIIAIALYLVIQGNLNKSITYVLLGGIALCVIILVAYRIPYIQEAFGSRLLAVFDESIEDGSIEARNRAAELARIQFRASPIVGKGWNAVASRYAYFYAREGGIYAHNNYLELLADFGVIGAILYYWKFFKDAICLFHKRNINIEAKLYFICFFIVLILDWGQVVYLYLYMMIIFGILFKGVQFIREEENINAIGHCNGLQ